MVDEVSSRVLGRFSLAKKTAVVTGGTKGIGLAIATAFVEAGARVAISSRSAQDLAETKKRLDQISLDAAVTIEVDHARWEEGAAFATQVRELVGPPDILVNNAGTGLVKSLSEITDDEWTGIQALNLFTPMALCREFVPNMRSVGWGRVVNISSLFGVIGLADRTAYSASKGGLIAFTRSLAVEVARHGVTANCLAAGPIRTHLTRHSYADPERHARLASLTPAGRWGEPTEVASVALLLASEAGSYVTGQTILVDGGASAQ